MLSLKLTTEEVLLGYDAVCALYPHVPPLSHWRAWEYAAYQKYQLNGRILDLGCGDGRYFKLLWPAANNTVGVDMDSIVAGIGRESGVYREVHISAADHVPEESASFDYVFANCSLEHMDNLDGVLAEIHRCLKPGGRLLCSVVTDRFVQWSLLPNLVEMAGFESAAKKLHQSFVAYHHLANPLSTDEWIQRLSRSGLTIEEHTPILPKFNSGIFLLMDALWHVSRADSGELGDIFYPFLSQEPNFPSAFRYVIKGLLDMETDWNDCSGAVFLARKDR